MLNSFLVNTHTHALTNACAHVGLADRNAVRIKGYMIIIGTIQDEVHKLEVRQTSLEGKIGSLKATNLTAETE